MTGSSSRGSLISTDSLIFSLQIYSTSRWRSAPNTILIIPTVWRQTYCWNIYKHSRKENQSNRLYMISLPIPELPKPWRKSRVPSFWWKVFSCSRIPSWFRNWTSRCLWFVPFENRLCACALCILTQCPSFQRLNQDCDSDIRLTRRIQRDISERGRTVDDVIRQYHETVRPMHEEFVEPSKRSADLIVHSSGHSMDVSIRILVNHLRTETGITSG